MTFFSLLILWGAILCNNALSNTNIPSNSILATVNGHAVTLGEVLKESSSSEALAKAYTEQKEISGAVAKLRQDTVDRIIDRKLLIDEFTRLKLFLPPKYIESMLDDLAINLNCRSRSELAAKARALNSSLEELRSKAIERLQAEMVIGREYYAVGEPTPEEMYNYFKTNIKNCLTSIY